MTGPAGNCHIRPNFDGNPAVRSILEGPASCAPRSSALGLFDPHLQFHLRGGL
jgi:hypothetical protein